MIFNRIGYILTTIYFLYGVNEGQMMELKGVRKRTQILDDLRNRIKHWELK
jgi:hypothetical protein